MRLLHTSDWHLGASLGNVSREPEQARFLDWLAETIEARQVDALVVAGDVFDHAQPSAEALRLYYGFLRRLAGISGLRKVVVVGGNHDSASRIDAPREVLEALDVHVVGGLRSDPESWDRCLCPVEADGRVLGGVVAVPFVHEFRLGVRTTAGDAATVAAEFRAAVTGLYATLAARARERWPDAPLVATGHLTCAGARREDYDQPIHQVGTLGELPAEVFDPAYRYVALGHIHRSYRVGESRAWYSGAPLAYSFRDGSTPRRVLLVDLSDGADGEARPEPIAVPAWRRLVQLKGTADEVEAGLRDLTWEEDLPPIVGVEVAVESYVPGLASRLHDAIAAVGEGPRLVEVHQRARGGAADEEEHSDAPRLRDMTPEDVFGRLCEARGVTVDDALLAAFRELLTGPADEEAAA